MALHAQSGSKAWVLENAFTSLSFDGNTGLFSVRNKTSGQLVIKDAHFAAGDYKSSGEGLCNGTVKINPDRSKTLQVEWKGSGATLHWFATLPANKTHFLFRMSMQNTGGAVFQLKYWSPLQGGTLYEGAQMQNVKMLDGNGGGEATKVQDGGYLRCRNNALVTFKQPNVGRTSWVGGGISYRDFEKHVLVETDAVRKADIIAANKKANMKLVSYLDLGEEGWAFDEAGTGLIVQRAWPYPFHSAQVREIGTTVYGGRQIILEAQKLDPQKKYSLGISWMDEGDGRMQSIFIQSANDTNKVPLLMKRYLPESNKGKLPEELVFRLPQKFTAGGSCRILIQKDAGPNTVLSEAWLNEGWPEDNPHRSEIAYRAPQFYKASLYAQDPVGRRIDPGQRYDPSLDLFYLDAVTSDPFTALETYGKELKRIIKINNLAIYTFPTTCLWYASHHNYGGGPSVNDSPGAVEEMRRADSSGITKYTKVAIRLVPDHYGGNNEQGWWDDVHWQRYGSGDDNTNSVQVKGGHYKEPYPTTKSWATAISKMGGIPITYVQTARRSEDFAKAYPQWMLFNESFHTIPDSNWLTLGYSSYDFTDTGFLRHMRGVYENLREGGVRGMMFDYTSTAWADFGGMENKYSTAAAMYRKVFEIASEGLGPKSWLHERNLERGTDLTLGFVASQRVWGDTDGITEEMVSRTGLRWYKNRVVVSYDMDSKNTEKLRQKSLDLLRQMLTMSYVASGRLLLGNSYAKMTAEDVHDLSRVFPFYETPQSARPVDAFISKWPSVYDFKVVEGRHLVTLYNTSNDSVRSFNVPMQASNAEGGLALNTQKGYHAYDFWNKTYVGLLPGSSVLKQELRPGEARLIALQEKKPEPQVLSTNRHIYQGYLDLSNVVWNVARRTLGGEAAVVSGDPFEIVIACNGRKPLRCMAAGASCELKRFEGNNELCILKINSAGNTSVSWTVQY